MRRSMTILTLSALFLGLAAADSAEAYSKKVVKKKHTVTRKHVTKSHYGGRKVVHKTVKKVTKVKKVKKVYGHPHGYHGPIQAHGYGPTYVSGYNPAYAPVYGPAYGSFGAVELIGDHFGLSFSIGSPAPGIYPEPVAYTYSYEQIYVSPVTETRQVGVDLAGSPIFQEVVLSSGYYRTAKFIVFPDGRREFVQYLP